LPLDVADPDAVESRAQAIVANKFFPGLLDRYLAKNGYSGQLTNDPTDPQQPDNLFDPVPGDPGTHGRFEGRSSDWSLQLWATEHRAALMTGALTIAMLATSLLLGAKPLAKNHSLSSDGAS
jgi:hypothetical protein